MARGIYEVTLKHRYFPALSAVEALEMQNNGECRGILQEDDVQVNCVVKEEHTMKLFILAKTMYDTEKFELSEVQAAVSSLAIQLGYYFIHEEITDSILTWVDRFMDTSLNELQEWIIG